MTPAAEKAKELVDKYMAVSLHDSEGPTSELRKISTKQAKVCAIIAVELILEGEHLIRTPLSYWENVKNEIEKL